MGSPQPSPAGQRPATQSAARTDEDVIATLLAASFKQIPEGGYGLRVLTTTGRRTGRLHLTPVGVLAHRSRWYLVCPDRRRDWPRNLLARPGCLIQIGTHRRECVAVVVTGETGVDVVAAYVSTVRAPWALRSFGLGQSPDRQEIERALPRFAVFRLDPAAGAEGAA